VIRDIYPRSLEISEDRISLQTDDGLAYLDIDLLLEFSHIPHKLRQEMKSNIRVMHGYCKMFRYITEHLEKGRLPTKEAIEQKIRYSLCVESKDAQLFLDVGGSPSYPIVFLLDSLKRTLQGGQGELCMAQGLSSLPGCVNDKAFDIVRQKLLNFKSE
jgi:hypothetical protein